ncbi:MAG: hypothetical protein R6U31_05925 [bacterium]
MKPKLGLILIISTFLLFTNCLTMTYHSPRVVEPNTFQIGGGVSAAPMYADMYRPAAEIFMKYGMPNGFDLGVHLNTSYLPDGIGLSVKKQFDFDKLYLDAVNFEYGMTGNGIFPSLLSYGEFFAGINIIKGDFALQFRAKQEETTLYPFMIDPRIFNMVVNEYSIGLSYELSLYNHNILLFVRGEYQNEYENDGSFEQNTGYGGGISYYFNLK